MSADHEKLLTAVDFYRADSDYWKTIAVEQGTTLAECQKKGYLVGDLRHLLPPEPPEGTGFRGHHDGVVKWFRGADGWVCRVANCRRCPVDWAEVCDHLSPNWRRELPGEPIQGRQAIHYGDDFFIDNEIRDHRIYYRPLSPNGKLTSPLGELNPEGFVETYYREALISYEYPEWARDEGI